jgi:hypothetical protein
MAIVKINVILLVTVTLIILSLQFLTTVVFAQNRSDISDLSSLTNTALLTDNRTDIGFSIKYPPTWNKTDTQEHVILTSPTNSAFIVSSRTLPIPPSLNHRQALAVIASFNLNFLKERYNVISSGTTTVGGILSYGAVYLDNNAHKFMWIWTLVGDKVYTFQYINTEANYDVDLPTVKAIMQSFSST